jgi:hypothetical protein
VDAGGSEVTRIFLCCTRVDSDGESYYEASFGYADCKNVAAGVYTHLKIVEYVQVDPKTWRPTPVVIPFKVGKDYEIMVSEKE